MRVLVAGATGVVGKGIVLLLKARGHFVRTVSKDAQRAKWLESVADDVRLLDATQARALEGSCSGVQMVVSALGAPVAPNRKGRQSFAEVDLKANLNLLGEAKRAGVKRFVYVGVYTEAIYAETAYVVAHARVERAVRAAGLEYGFVRTTGVFGALADLLPMAQKGPVPLIGDGAALTNPIDERDVADAALRALEAPGSTEVDIGGPEALSRRRIAELAFQALGRQPRFVALPVWVLRVIGFIYGFFNRRMADFLSFVVLAASHSCVAPSTGKRRLLEYFEARVQSLGLPKV